MKPLAICSALSLLLLVSPIRAEKPIGNSGLGPNASVSLGEMNPTPEMWFYEQAMRQYKDPKVAVRTNAEYRAQQRQRRIESMKWFGFSKSRPQVSSDPFNGDYSPHWVANPGYYPSRWNGVGMP